jgi:hypothetical protein
MNQQELRLGNAILVNGEIQIVTQLPLPENCNNENTKGVPITYKRLRCLGFQNIVEKSDTLSLDLFIQNGEIWFYSDDEDNYSDVYVSHDNEKDGIKIGDSLRFIHEFQNLMFCLTKEEVNIDFLIR